MSTNKTEQEDGCEDKIEDATHYNTDSSSGNELLESDFPPPVQYIRRNSSTSNFTPVDSPTPGTFPLGPLLPRVRSFPVISCIDFEKSVGELNGPQQQSSHSDKLTQRKLKLQSPGLPMSQSMPNLRNIRALYNRGVAKSLRDPPEVPASTPATTTCQKSDQEIFDSLLCGL
jgi:hypothetical protein